jgi:hypothetical protein
MMNMATVCGMDYLMIETGIKAINCNNENNIDAGKNGSSGK